LPATCKASFFLVILVVTATGLFVSVQPAYAKSLCGTTIKTSVTLTADLTCHTAVGIKIGANGITLNCAGHVIDGSGTLNSEGIYLPKRSHVTVENCHVEDFYFAGIFLYHSSHNTVKNNVLSGDNTISDGCGSGEQGAIQVWSSSSSNTITDNVASGNYCQGFIVLGGSSNTLSNNLAESNLLYGFRDFTTGSGTADTANTYTSNTCMSNNSGGAQSSPVGLC